MNKKSVGTLVLLVGVIAQCVWFGVQIATGFGWVPVLAWLLGWCVLIFVTAFLAHEPRGKATNITDHQAYNSEPKYGERNK